MSILNREIIPELSIKEVEKRFDKFKKDANELIEDFNKYFSYNSFSENKIDEILDGLKEKFTGKVKYERELVELSGRCNALAKAAKDLGVFIEVKQTEIYLEQLNINESFETIQDAENSEEFKVLSERFSRLGIIKEILSTKIAELEITNYDVHSLNPNNYDYSSNDSIHSTSSGRGVFIEETIANAKNKLGDFVTTSEEVLDLAKTIQLLRYDVLPYLIEQQKNDEYQVNFCQKKFIEELDRLKEINPEIIHEEAMRDRKYANRFDVLNYFENQRALSTKKSIEAAMLLDDLSVIESVDGYKYSCKANDNGTFTVVRESDNSEQKIDYSSRKGFLKSQVKLFDNIGDIKDEITFNDKGQILSRDWQAVFRGMGFRTEQSLDFSTLSEKIKLKLQNVIEGTLLKGKVNLGYQTKTLEEEASVKAGGNLKLAEFRDDLKLSVGDKDSLRVLQAGVGAGLMNLNGEVVASMDLLECEGKASFSFAEADASAGLNDLNLIKLKGELAKRTYEISKDGIEISDKPYVAKLSVGNNIEILGRDFVSGESETILDKLSKESLIKTGKELIEKSNSDIIGVYKDGKDFVSNVIEDFESYKDVVVALFSGMDKTNLISTGKIEREENKRVEKAKDTIEKISEEIGFKKTDDLSTEARNFSIDL